MALRQAGKYFEASTNLLLPTYFFEPCGAGLPTTETLKLSGKSPPRYAPRNSHPAASEETAPFQKRAVNLTDYSNEENGV
jgi:hypothetical protein